MLAERIKTHHTLSQPTLWLVLVILLSLVLYTFTLAPDILWGGGDFAEYQTRAYFNVTTREMGIFDHPLWVIIAHQFTKLPFQNPAWRANFASAVFAAIAIGFVFLSAWKLTYSRMASLLAAGSLAVSHTFWTYAVMPKVYSLNALLLSSCCYLLLQWRERDRNIFLYLFAFFYGLSFLNHLVMATAALGFITFIGIRLWRWQIPKAKIIIGTICSFAIGIAPYLILTLQAGTTASIGGKTFAFLQGILFALTHPNEMFKALGLGGLLSLYQFPFTLPIGVWGLRILWRKDRASASLIIFGILGAVLFLLAASDPEAGGVYIWNLHYYLQAYVIFSLALGIGFNKLLNLRFAHTLIQQTGILVGVFLLPIIIYLIAPTITRFILPDIPDFRPLPERDNFVYVLSPWKHTEKGPRIFGEQVLDALPADSVLFADYGLWAVFQYLQVVEGKRRDVTLVNLSLNKDQIQVILEYRNRENLFLADTYRYYDLDAIQQYFSITPQDPIFRLDVHLGNS